MTDYQLLVLLSFLIPAVFVLAIGIIFIIEYFRFNRDFERRWAIIDARIKSRQMVQSHVNLMEFLSRYGTD